MTVPPHPEAEELELAAAFPAADRDRWRELVKGVLRRSGAATDDTPLDTVEDLLATMTYDGIAVAPLYTAESLSGGAPAAQGAVPGRPGLPPYARGVSPGSEVLAGWDVRQRHVHPDPAVTREAIKADLEHGATSIWLVLGPDALPEALRDVYLDLAPVVLDAGAQTPAAAEALFALAAKKGVDSSALLGNLGADPLGLAARTGGDADLSVATALAVRSAKEFPGLRAIVVDATVYHDAGGSDAEELGCSIAAGVGYLRALTEAGLTVDEALGELEFRYAATADQFLTIAKLRAARRLWARVAEVSGGPGKAASRRRLGQRQHAVTSSAMMTARDPWVNMLRTTVAAFAAGVGGADAVTVLPFDAGLGLPDDFSRRIARNTQSLLLEEASLSRVADPAGGSWYVERLTEDLAQAAWAWFQEIERAGGLAAALAGGMVAERLARTWERRRDNLAHRRDPITGVSEFPNLAEKLPVRTPAPETATAGLPRVTYAQDFEALRDAADRAPTRPKVFLATLGTVAQYTARATFAANLFQAGGIETVISGPGTDPEAIARAFEASGATVVCLCSGDGLYAEHAASVAGVLKATGARRVWLAGRGEYEGVDSCLYAGCDALDVLRTTLQELGVSL